MCSSDLPRPGAVHPIGAVATLGGDPGSTVVIDDPVVADEALVLAFRGSHWVILGSAAGRGVRVNGTPAADGTLLGFGDELAIGAVVLRLDHPGPG